MTLQRPAVRLLALVVACAAVVACAYPPTQPGGSRDLCFQEPEVVEYLLRMRDRALAGWESPSGAAEGSEVVVGFELTSLGLVTALRPQGSSDPAMVAAANKAVVAGAPYGNLAGPVRCLEDKRLFARFVCDAP